MQSLMKSTAIAISLAAPLVITPAAAAEQQFTAQQKQGEWTASTLIGQSVVNAQNETVGDVNDLVFSSEGKLAAIVIGVGGFLGLGEKNVAVPLSLVKVEGNKTKDASLRVNLSKSSLTSAPVYKPLSGVGMGTVGKLMQQAKDVSSDVSAAAKKAVDQGQRLGNQAVEKASEVRDSVTGEKQTQ